MVCAEEWGGGGRPHAAASLLGGACCLGVCGGVSVTWEEAVALVRSVCGPGVPLLLKGVLSPHDAVRAAQLGCEVSKPGPHQPLLQQEASGARPRDTSERGLAGVWADGRPMWGLVGGRKGIIVSNHGGRQVRRATGTAAATDNNQFSDCPPHRRRGKASSSDQALLSA